MPEQMVMVAIADKKLTLPVTISVNQCAIIFLLHHEPF